MTKKENMQEGFQDKMMKYFADSYAKEFLKQHPFPCASHDAAASDEDDSQDEGEDEVEGQDPFSLLKEMLGKLSASMDKHKNFDFKAEQAKVEAEFCKVPEFREYRKFLDWAFGERDGGLPIDFVESFAKLHPSLPAIKMIEHENANRDANIGLILFQAAKYYFEIILKIDTGLNLSKKVNN